MPLPPSSLADLKWFLSQGYLLMEFPLGLLWHFITVEKDNKLLEALLNLHFLPVPFVAAGLYVLYKGNKTMLMVLLFPVFLALLASGFEVYPFYDRLLVFLAPSLILIVAFGTQKLAGFFPSQSVWRHVLPFLILLGPLYASAQQVYDTELFGDRKHWHLREALLYINDRAKEGDVVYINWNALPEYRYYKQVYNFQFTVMEGKDVRKISKDTAEYFRNLQPDIEAMSRYDRAWVLWNKVMGANIGEVEGPNDIFGQKIKDGKRFAKHLSTIGRQKNAYRSKDTDVFLFDFSNN